jgi:hypothetical protein
MLRTIQDVALAKRAREKSISDQRERTERKRANDMQVDELRRAGDSDDDEAQNEEYQVQIGFGARGTHALRSPDVMAAGLVSSARAGNTAEEYVAQVTPRGLGRCRN